MDAPEFHPLTDSFLLLLLLEEFHLVYHVPFTVFAASHTPVTFNITTRSWMDGWWEYNQDKCCHVYVRFVAPFTRMICGLVGDCWWGPLRASSPRAKWEFIILRRWTAGQQSVVFHVKIILISKRIGFFFAIPCHFARSVFVCTLPFDGTCNPGWNWPREVDPWQQPNFSYGLISYHPPIRGAFKKEHLIPLSSSVDVPWREMRLLTDFHRHMPLARMQWFAGSSAIWNGHWKDECNHFFKQISTRHVVISINGCFLSFIILTCYQAILSMSAPGYILPLVLK